MRGQALGELVEGRLGCRGSMAGEEDDDKENTPVHGRRKKGEEVRTSLGRSGGRRLSLSGSKTRPRYLKDIARKFQLKSGSGRGRLTKHRPLQVDVSPYNFKPRYVSRLLNVGLGNFMSKSPRMTITYSDCAVIMPHYYASQPAALCITSICRNSLQLGGF